VDKINVITTSSVDDKIIVRLFAILREAVGKKEIVITLPRGSTVKTLKNKILHEHPSLNSFNSQFIISVNHEAVPGDTVVSIKDVIAALPPVSGG
jgi:molybdopterin converting factor subunit 1